MKVFALVGLHHTGKTTAVEALIRYIKSRGQSVSSIKDIHQQGWTMEKVGSNSHRHLVASGSAVFARGNTETHLIWDRQLSLREMLSHLNTQWVIIEGMHEVPLPQIIAANGESDIETLLTPTTFAITGKYAETHKDYKGIPCLNALTDIEALGSLVWDRVFPILPFAADGHCGHCGYDCQTLTSLILSGEKTRSDCGLKTTQDISIKVAGEEVPLNEWVSTLSIDLIKALCSNLKGYKEGGDIEIAIKKKR